MKVSKHTSENVLNIFKERATIEEEYAKKLIKLSKSVSFKDELGTLKGSLDSLRVEIETGAKVHLDLAVDMRVNLEKQMAEFIAAQSVVRKNVYLIN